MSNRLFVLLCLGSFFLVLFGCRSGQSSFKSAQGGYIAIGPRDRATSRSMRMDSILSVYKGELDVIMSRELTVASRDYLKTAPDYAIQRVAIDAMKVACAELGLGRIDGAIMNIDGVRGNLSSGSVTLGVAYTLFPFENELSLIQIKGSYLKALEQLHASSPKVITSGFSDFLDDQLYSIVTIDYLVEGNDYCELLTKSVKESKLNLLLRDVMIEYFKGCKL